MFFLSLEKGEMQFAPEVLSKVMKSYWKLPLIIIFSTFSCHSKIWGKCFREDDKKNFTMCLAKILVKIRIARLFEKLCWISSFSIFHTLVVSKSQSFLIVVVCSTVFAPYKIWKKKEVLVSAQQIFCVCTFATSLCLILITFKLPLTDASSKNY